MKIKIEGIVVVEGKSDTRRLQQYFDVVTYETSGLGLNEQMLEELQQLAKEHQLIILTDPDMPGERIRRMISEKIPNCQHAIVSKNQAKSPKNGRLGIEYSEKKALEEAFSLLHIPVKDNRIRYTNEDMLTYGFIGRNDSKKRRDFIATRKRLGRVNGKQFLKRLNLFNIEKADLENLLNQYEGGRDE